MPFSIMVIFDILTKNTDRHCVHREVGVAHRNEVQRNRVVFVVHVNLFSELLRSSVQQHASPIPAGDRPLQILRTLVVHKTIQTPIYDV